MASRTLLQIKSASIIRYGSLVPLIEPFFDWTIKSDERWAIVGKIGSGKSTLGSALAGRLRWVSPTAEASIPLPWQFEHGPSVRLMAFTDSTYKAATVQDRYHARVDDDEVTAAEFILGAEKERNLSVAIRDAEGNITNKPQLAFKDPLAQLDPVKRRIAEKFNLSQIAKLPMIRLSNGQLMRVRLAKALLFSDLASAKYLILDEPMMGLDVATRKEFGDLLGDLTKDPAFPTIMLLMRPQDSLPSWITHVLELDKLSVVFQGSHAEYDAHREEKKRKAQQNLVDGLKPVPVTGEPIVELKNVNVAAVDGTKILTNVDWSIKKGQKWGLTGANGSGKTTLLSILVGDHPQAYSNDVTLFGHRRGEPGVSIWDIKEKIGFVSPEFHFHFTSRFLRGFINGADGKPAVTVLDAVCTGFGSGDNSAQQLTKEQLDAAEQIMRDFGFWEKRDIKFVDLSMGEQRMGLIMRALVKKPPLVIMDEPFQGVDEDCVEIVHKWMEREFLNSDQSLVFVSHHEEEMPRILTNMISLEKGEVVKCV
ncbi:hypothetical protein HDU79_006887 [Rhizoclosmatium sp. JEL0117]|nr:hypothetical protein HDU79_006887 [Rhizoclosmatium sp. JEL0117]